MDDLDRLKNTLAEFEKFKPAIAWLKIFLKDIAGSNDRAAAITAMAMLEEELKRVLISRFIPISNTIADNLFHEGGPLSGLESKINMSYALGIYGQQTRSDLHLARRIRNRFARYFEVSTFEHDRVINLCNSLQLPELMPGAVNKLQPNTSKPRAQYIVTCSLVFTTLHHLTDLQDRISVMSSGLP